MSDDGSFRVIAAQTTETVRGASTAQRASGAIACAFGELLTGAVLVRESMAPDLRVQVILQGDDPRARMVADAHPGGTTRGLVQIPVADAAGGMRIGERGLLQIARTLHNGSIHQGVVSVPEAGTISSAFMSYMQSSEQIVTMIAVGCQMDGDDVLAAGGYLVQLLPELEEELLMVMTERLRDFESMAPLFARNAASPEELLAETLYGMPHTVVGTSELAFGCTCSPARLAASLATLSKADIKAMLEEGRMLDIECDFCRTRYEYSPEQLRGLLQPN